VSDYYQKRLPNMAMPHYYPHKLAISIQLDLFCMCISVSLWQHASGSAAQPQTKNLDEREIFFRVDATKMEFAVDIFSE
jgi:hypothetical protein